ncbi:MAG: L-rhamnose mutarotase [Mucilaginibacter sp.]
MKRYCFAVDLKDDAESIVQYEYWHKAENGWPEIRKSILDANVRRMDIYRTGNRLFMIMDVNDQFSFAEKSAMDAANSKVREWEELMNRFQQPLPWAKDGEKWTAMQQIFEL